MPLNNKQTELCYNWAKLSGENENIIKEQDQPDKPIIVNSPEMVNSFKGFILTERRFTIEVNLFKLLGISISTAHKIVHDDFVFSKLIRRCVLSPASDFNFFNPLKEFLHRRKFSSDEKMKITNC